jgi:hypothetical protein
MKSSDYLPPSEGREACLQKEWLQKRLMFLRMTHPVDDVVALMEEFYEGCFLEHDTWE